MKDTVKSPHPFFQRPTNSKLNMIGFGYKFAAYLCHSGKYAEHLNMKEILQISPYFLFQRAANGPRLPDRRPLSLTASQAKVTSASTVSSKHPPSKSAFQQIALRYGPKNLSLALFQSLNQ